MPGHGPPGLTLKYYCGHPRPCSKALTNLEGDRCMSTNGHGIIAEYDPLNLTIPRARISERLKFGVVGYGYWGPNIVRNLQNLPEAEITVVCDTSTTARKRAHKGYPNIYVTADVSEVMTSPEADAIAIVTPVWTHFELAKAALENGKHVFLEKPL